MLWVERGSFREDQGEGVRGGYGGSGNTGMCQNLFSLKVPWTMGPPVQHTNKAWPCLQGALHAKEASLVSDCGSGDTGGEVGWGPRRRCRRRSSWMEKHSWYCWSVPENLSTPGRKHHWLWWVLFLNRHAWVWTLRMPSYPHLLGS